MGTTFIKISRLLRAKGPVAVVRRGFARIQDLLRLRSALARQPDFDGVDALLDFAFSHEAALITPAQIRSEIDTLLRHLQAAAPRRILEIGTANGGSLFLWTRIAAPDAHLISLDLPGGQFGDGYARWKRPLYRSFARGSQRITLIQDDSHLDRSLEAIRAQLGGEPLDFLFIDGDHTYAGVRRDFEMYSPLVRSGGLVAFHDIASHNDPTCQVDRFWNELKPHHDCTEILASPSAGWAGLGLIRMP